MAQKRRSTRRREGRILCLPPDLEEDLQCEVFLCLVSTSLYPPREPPPEVLQRHLGRQKDFFATA